MSQQIILTRPDGIAVAAIEHLAPHSWAWWTYDPPFDPRLEQPTGSSLGGVESQRSKARFQAFRAASREGSLHVR